MTFHISRSEVFQALSQVRHPEIQSRNLVELGMIPEVIVEGTQVLVMLALPLLDAPIRQELVDALQLDLIGPTGPLGNHKELLTKAEHRSADEVDSGKDVEGGFRLVGTCMRR